MKNSKGQSHKCPEWDYALISPDDPEFEVCSCEFLYDKNRPARELEPFYSRHVQAMTREDLHSKSDIAKELAYRDMRLARLAVAYRKAQGAVGRYRLLMERKIMGYQTTGDGE